MMNATASASGTGSSSSRPGGSRSSRRMLRSTAPVQLGGGVGILGTSMNDELKYNSASSHRSQLSPVYPFSSTPAQAVQQAYIANGGRISSNPVFDEWGASIANDPNVNDSNTSAKISANSNLAVLANASTSTSTNASTSTSNVSGNATTPNSVTTNSIANNVVVNEAKSAPQRALGITSTEWSPPLDSERKVSGLSLKKSSGALKALFRGRAKDSSINTPPLPTESKPRKSESGGRPSIALDDGRRPSFSFQRSSIPTETKSRKSESGGRRPSLAPEDGHRPSFSIQRALSPGPKIVSILATSPNHGQMSPEYPSHATSSSSAAERSLYPTTLNQQRAVSPKSPPPQFHSRSPPAAPPPSRELPPLPLGVEDRSIQQTTSLSLSQSYLSPIEAGFRRLPPLSEANHISQVSEVSRSVRPTSSVTTDRPTLGANSWSPVKPSRSLHLLQLPELDLDLNFAFDGINSATPSTPRKRSPRKLQTGSVRTPSSSGSPRTERPSPGPSPTRSMSVSAGSLMNRATSERRRSKSFDGPAQDLWRPLAFDAPGSSDWMPPQMTKLFTSSSSSSAPLLSPPALPCDVDAAGSSGLTLSSDITLASPPMFAPPSHSFSHSNSHSLSHSLSHSHSHSVSSQRSALSSNHSQEQSDTSSIHETSTPSPPRTPEEAPSHFSLANSPPDYGPLSLTPKPSDSEGSRTQLNYGSLDPPAVISPPVLINMGLGPDVHVGVLQPAAVIDSDHVQPVEPTEHESVRSPFTARERRRALQHKSIVILSNPNMSTRMLTRELERILDTFRYPSHGTTGERSSLIRSELLPMLSEIEKRTYDVRDETVNRTLREVCFEWADALLFELRVEQPANERGACLEGLAGVLESSCLSQKALDFSRSHSDTFLDLMMKVMRFVMDKLGAKGVFHNTLLFSGRFLAFAFFRIPHVGGQLVGVLQPPRGTLMRFTRPILMGKTIPIEAQPNYPSHLASLCFDDAQSYTRRLLSLDPDFDTEAEKDAFHFQPGNWLRRWQSDDSELFPAFYRAYHRQLANYLAPAVEYYEKQNQSVPAHVLLRAPGYAHLATIFSKKCHSYILGSVNAVTTSSSAQNFDTNESAGFRGSQKPAVLETANRRLVETLYTFATSLVVIPAATTAGGGRVIECDGAQLWGDMIDLWTKNLISKTSLYAPKGVFCLFDLLDGIVDPTIEGSTQSPVDIPHLIGIVRLILNQGEHALTLVKVIAFVFTHWEILTANADDRRELCLDILLDKALFERLLLFWSQSVRSYVLRLVVFRLGHLHTSRADGVSYDVEIESVRLLQTRLGRIKRRYDELEPPQPPIDEVDSLPVETQISLVPVTPTNSTFASAQGMSRSRSTITMVPDSPNTASANKAERLLGLGMGINDRPKLGIETGNGTGGASDKESAKVGKAASWWKRSFGKQKKRAEGSSRSPSLSPSPSLNDSSPTVPASLPVPPGPTRTPSPVLLAPPALAPSLMPRSTPKLNANLDLPASPVLPAMSSESSSSSSSLSSSPNSTRKGRPPRITTTSPSTPDFSAASAYAFEFELPTASPRSDTFDPSPSPSSPRRNSQPPSPRQPQSPHMSRSFSKRSSLLPPPTASALESIMSEGAVGTTIAGATASIERKTVSPSDEGYHPRLHAYAIRMLAELEDAQKEYDEWWSEGGVGKVDGAPPRLAVAWPFHEGEE